MEWFKNGLNDIAAGLPGLDEDEVSGSTQEPESQHNDDPITIEKMMVQQPR